MIIAMADQRFKEFALSLHKSVAVVNRKLLDGYGIIGGYDLSAEGKGFDNTMLVSITELHSEPRSTNW